MPRHFFLTHNFAGSSSTELLM